MNSEAELSDGQAKGRAETEATFREALRVFTLKHHRGFTEHSERASACESTAGAKILGPATGTHPLTSCPCWHLYNSGDK